MKKKTEIQVVLTFAIMLAFCLIINGIYSVITLKSSFITLQVIIDALWGALSYLFYVWFFSRKHRILFNIGLVTIICIYLLTGYASNGEVINMFEATNWRDVVMTIYYIVAAIIAHTQGDKLLEENNNCIQVKEADEKKIENSVDYSDGSATIQDYDYDFDKS